MQDEATLRQQFDRSDALFSLCGLNCALCGMRIHGECPGCLAGCHCSKMCPFAPCSVQHGGIQYCYECDEYPCKHYNGFDGYDTCVLHRNQPDDMVKAQRMGIDAYHARLQGKTVLLQRLVDNYDDGLSGVLFCMAVNLLEADVVGGVLAQLDKDTAGKAVAERAQQAERSLCEAAQGAGISLEAYL